MLPRDAAPDRPQLAGQTEADIAVVGGGFAGLHTARLLVQQGQRVVLVERHRIAWGAWGATAASSVRYAARSGLVDRQAGLDHSRRLMRNHRSVSRSYARRSTFGRPDILMGPAIRRPRTDQGADFADASRRLAEQLGARFEPLESTG